MKTLALAILLGPVRLLAQDELDPVAVPVKAEPREAAVFKDGHAFVVSEATIPPKSGWYVTLDVPEAILGTFWVFPGNPKARVESVRAGFEVVDEKRPCLTLPESLEAAVGREVVLTLSETPASRALEGTLVDLPKSAPERATADAPADFLPGEVLHVRTPGGLEIVRKAAVSSIRLKKEAPIERTVKVVRRRILVKVAVDPDLVLPVPLRFMYVQTGLRWIPEYRVELLPDRKIRLALQATMVNDLADFRDLGASFVVGIPNFLMKETLSPLALREAAVRVAPYLRQAGQAFLSNAISSQAVAYQEPLPAPAAVDPAMDLLAKGSSADEYFLYSRPHVTLRKGERASFPIFEGTFGYEDVYTLSLPPSPPRQVGIDRSEELHQALQSPKVMHALRLRNAGGVPWTTGPALIMRDGRALSQDLLRFTPAGGQALLPVAELSDVAVRIHDVEQNRTTNVRIDGVDYTQVFMKGTITLVSRRTEPVGVEIDRTFFGQVDKVDNGGASEAFDFALLPRERYGTASWPWWWGSVNGMFQARWKAMLETGKAADLSASWSYFRR
ncbi:MAG TPA: hypothetical protein VEN81_01655 [Planctomycetota bacterium]|nr:hypothetical protein [Planctomycetota bacterium]